MSCDYFRYLFSKLTGDPLDNVTAENVFDLTVPDGRKLYELRLVALNQKVNTRIHESFLIMYQSMVKKFLCSSHVFSGTMLKRSIPIAR